MPEPPTQAWQRGLETLHRETSIDRLAVDGAVPHWLKGTLVRNGPGSFENRDGTVSHWFFGLAMLHAFSFADGQVGYRNRYLDTAARRRATGRGDGLAANDFAVDPCGSIFHRVAARFLPRVSDNANINVGRRGDRLVAMTESRLSVEFDPETLETVGVVDSGDELGLHADTAHPHYGADGELVNHGLRFGLRSDYRLHRVPRDGRAELIARIPVRHPGYIHSFGLTPRYAVLVEFPYVINPLDLLRPGRPFFENFRWRPEQGTRFLVVDRVAGRLVRTLHAPAVFGFHHVNAFERDAELCVDLVGYEDTAVVDSFYMDALRGAHPTFPPSRLLRYRLDLRNDRVERELLSDEPIALPRINYDANMSDYRCAYAVRYAENDFANALVKIDVADGSARTWSQDNTYPGEPVFVGSPDGRAEDDGVVLSVVLDGRTNRAFLLVLDAMSFQERARAHVPHHVPFGFHGQFLDVSWR